MRWGRAAMATDLKWGKARLEPPVRSLLDRGLGDLNRDGGEQNRPIRLPGGKQFICHVEDLWFCRVGDGGSPPRTWSLVVDSRLPQRTLLPTRSALDFEECCDILGFRAEEQRRRFRDFLDFESDTTSTIPA